MEGSKTLFCSSKFALVREKKILREYLGTHPQKGSPALCYGNR